MSRWSFSLQLAVMKSADSSIMELHGIIGTGNSLSLGAHGLPMLDTMLPSDDATTVVYEGALKLVDSTNQFDQTRTQAPTLTLATLVEPVRALHVPMSSWTYPNNVLGCTFHTAMGRQIAFLRSKLTDSFAPTVHTVVGQSNASLAQLGTSSSTYEVKAIKHLCSLTGYTYVPKAVVLTHGEADCTNSQYGAQVRNLLTAYQQDLADEEIQLLLTQQNSEPVSSSSTIAQSTLSQWTLSTTTGSHVSLACPRYPFPHSQDGVHLNAMGYHQLGLKLGQVFHHIIDLNRVWLPLTPTAWTCSCASAPGSTPFITLTFHVPSPPLRWDTSSGRIKPALHETNHTGWKNGKGFEVLTQDDVNGVVEIPIDRVELDSENNKAVIYLKVKPVSNSVVVQYAVSQDRSALSGGTAYGRRGFLCDSDSQRGYEGSAAQPNYCVAFSVPVSLELQLRDVS